MCIGLKAFRHMSNHGTFHQSWQGLVAMESPQRVYSVTYLTILRGQSPTWSSWMLQRLAMRAVKRGGRWDAAIAQGNYGIDAGSQPLDCAAIPHQDW
jgi:hypothetical protein